MKPTVQAGWSLPWATHFPMKIAAIKYQRQHDQLSQADQEDHGVLWGSGLQKCCRASVRPLVPGLLGQNAQSKCLQVCEASLRCIAGMCLWRAHGSLPDDLIGVMLEKELSEPLQTLHGLPDGVVLDLVTLRLRIGHARDKRACKWCLSY